MEPRVSPYGEVCHTIQLLDKGNASKRDMGRLGNSKSKGMVFKWRIASVTNYMVSSIVHVNLYCM